MASPVIGLNGAVDSLLAVARDISEQQWATGTIGGGEEELNDFFESAAIGFHWVGPDGIILRANRADFELLGYARDEYVGHHIAEFHADAHVIEDILRLLVKGEPLVNYPARLRRKDGAIKDVLIDSSVYRKDGRFIHTRCFTRDVTFSRHAEEQMERAFSLEQSARRRAETTERRMGVLADITRSMSEALDLDTVLRRIAEGAQELCASDTATIFLRSGDTDEMVPRHHVGPALRTSRTLRITPGHGLGGLVMEKGVALRTDDYLKDSRVPPDLHAVAEQTATVALLVVPITLNRRIEGLLYIGSTGPRPFTDEDEAICLRLADHGAIAIQNARLFLSERAARAEAEAVNRAKDEFLAVLSHELRTPLTAIIGWTRLILGARLDEDRAKRGLEIVDRNARLQARLIGDLLDVSRIVTGKLELERRPVDLASVVGAAIEAIRPAAEAKQLTLSLHLEVSGVPIMGDPTRLQQVIGNLLSNAVKFTPPGGQIFVASARAGANVRLTVRDTGAGIAADVLPHIFDRFRQGDSSTRRIHGGLGLGLAIARQLVEMHAGTIEAVSGGEGQGATFTLELPVVGEDVSMLRVPALTSRKVADDRHLPSLEGLRVLIVDDEVDTRELLATLIGNCGAEVSQASTVSQGLDTLLRVKPHIILADLGLPGENGYDLIRRIRALGPGLGDTPAIALTAYASVADRDLALSAGFVMHIPKPLDPPGLLQAIANVVRP